MKLPTLEKLYQKIDYTYNLHDNWDNNGAPKPNDNSRALMKRFLLNYYDQISGMGATDILINPCEKGGITLSYKVNSVTCHATCYNMES